MNEIKISGVIDTEIETARVGNRTIRSCLLRFTARGDVIRLVAVGLPGDDLARFQKNAGVLVTGRLLQHFETKRVAIFPDRVESYRVAVLKPDSLWMNHGQPDTEIEAERMEAVKTHAR